MRYQMRQKFFAFGDDFMIKDQHGDDVYLVDGKAFSWGDKLSFQDADTRDEIAFIAQKMWSFKPKYEIHRAGRVFAEVVKEFTWFNSKFTLDVPGPNDYEITGSFWKHEYSFFPPWKNCRIGVEENVCDDRYIRDRHRLRRRRRSHPCNSRRR